MGAKEAAKRAGERKFLHIVPVGTSILTNFGWKNGDPLPGDEELLAWLEKAPCERSAELNGLLWFVEKGECSLVHLVFTDTPACRLCRDVIADFLKNRDINTTGKGVKAKNLLPASFEKARDQESFYKAVRGFRELVFRAAEGAQNRGEEVLINATAGLKSEVAVAALVAAELNVSAYYIHQTMQQPVFLPTVQLSDHLKDALRNIAQKGKRGARASQMSGLPLDRLEREGLVKITRNTDGEMSNVKLTSYGKYLAGALSRK